MYCLRIYCIKHNCQLNECKVPGSFYILSNRISVWFLDSALLKFSKFNVVGMSTPYNSTTRTTPHIAVNLMVNVQVASTVSFVRLPTPEFQQQEHTLKSINLV